MTPSDSQVRVNIKSVIDTALNTLYVGNTSPRVWSRWILSLNLGENAAALRALSGNSKGKIHGWMIGTGSVLRQRPDIGDGFNTQSIQKRGPTRRDVIKGYRVWAFMQYREGDESINSENDFLAELEYIQDAIDKAPTLNFTDIEVRGHKSLIFPTIDVYPFGDTRIHLAQGVLEVVFHRHLI